MKENNINEKEYLTTNQIIEKAKNRFGIKTYDPEINDKTEDNIRRKIQRFAKDNI